MNNIFYTYYVASNDVHTVQVPTAFSQCNTLLQHMRANTYICVIFSVNILL